MSVDRCVANGDVGDGGGDGGDDVNRLLRPGVLPGGLGLYLLDYDTLEEGFPSWTRGQRLVAGAVHLLLCTEVDPEASAEPSRG